MLWSELLVITISAGAAFWLFFFSGKESLHAKFHLSLAVLCVFSAFVPFPVTDQVAAVIEEWVSILGVTFLLVMFALLIRELKPVYARYPFGFTYTPLLIPVVYPFIADADILKMLLNQILQGGVLAIALLLYIPVIRFVKQHLIYIISVLLLGVTFVIYWFEPAGVASSVWHLTLSFGILGGTYSLNKLFRTLGDTQVNN